MSVPRSSSILIGVCVTGIAVTLSACGSSSSASGGQAKAGGGPVVAYVGGDTNIKQLWQDTIIPAFQKANPSYHVRLVYSAHGAADATTLAKLQAAAKTKRDPGYDLLESSITPDAAAAGLLLKVSAATVPNLASVDPQLLAPVQNAAVPYRGSSVLLAYDAKAVSKPPTTLPALVAWIHAHPGRFTYNSPATGGSGQSFVQTILDRHLPAATARVFQTGYDTAKESAWKAGFAELRGLNRDVYSKGVYPNGNQAVLDLLGKGQIDLAPVWSDMFLSARQKGTFGPNIKAVQISNPSFTGGSAYVAVPQGSRHQAGALKLANFVLQPAQQAAIVDQIAGYPAIAVSKLPQPVQARLSGTNTSNLRPPYSGRTANDLNSAWQQQVPGK